jgi:predicted nucleic acid-binding protein
MAVLLDTNILLRLMNPQAPQAVIAERALNALRARSEELQISAQNLVEFWAVATRPVTENGLGLVVEQAIFEMSALKSLFVVLPEIPLQSEWSVWLRNTVCPARAATTLDWLLP